MAIIITNDLKEQRRLFNFTIRFQWRVEPAIPAEPGAATAGK